MLFQQLDIAHDHATVGGLAHVVDGEQADLYGGRKSVDFPRKSPRESALVRLYFLSTCPKFLGLVGQDWDKTPKPDRGID
jgi:hypothetical protein